MNRNEDRIKFCARFLAGNGVDPERYKVLYDEGAAPELSYVLIVQPDDAFFAKIAEGLREMWPPGNKNGNWSWRESVPVLVERLKFIWERERLEDRYSVEDCLQAGRRYLAAYENTSTKYMQILKYFIFKKKDVGVKENGVIKKTYESTLIKMLQDKEWEDMDNQSFDELVI